MKIYTKIIAALALLLPLSLSAQQKIHVKGTVTDENGEPLAGAAVFVKGTTTGTQCDEQGAYEIEVASNAVLLADFLGYETAEEAVSGRSSINFIMKMETNYLEELVVIGYGTQKKTNVTGSVTMVNYEDNVKSRAVTTTAQVLAGAGSGIYVTQASGKPGAEEISMRIRGVGTLNNSAPLVIVDGFEASIDSVSPDDIASVSVLKDAASCAIYGNRGANGVVLVTTKSGNSNKERHSVSYSSIVAVTTPSSTFKMVSNYADYMMMLNEAADNIGATAPFSQGMIDLWLEKEKNPNGISDSGYPNYVAYPNTDWMSTDGLYRKGIYHKHTISASGSSKSISYLVSGTYMYNPGIISNTAMQKAQLRANVSAKVTKWLELGMKMWGYESKREICDLDGAANYMMRRLIPGVYPYYDGKYGWLENPEQHSNSGNALYFVDRNKGFSKIRYQNATAFATVTFPLNIRWTTSFNYVHSGTETKYTANLQDAWSFRTGDVAYAYRDLSRTKGTATHANAYRWTLQSNLNWAKSFGKHDVSALLGYEMQYYNHDNLTGVKSQYSNFVFNEFASATKIESLTGTQYDYSSISAFMRATYAYDGKYLAEVNLRCDGSSRFAARSRWGVFPSVSLGWRISKENFMKGTGVDNLKLRASWGQLGNNSIGNYEYLATYADGFNYPFGGGDALSAGIVAELNNELLRWETTTSYNVGVEFGMFKNRLTFEADIYDRITNGILYRAPIFATAGNKTAPYQNICQVTNMGYELNIGWKDDINDFHYGISANFTHNRNCVSKYNGRLKAGWEDVEGGGREYVSNIGDVSTSGGWTRVMEGKIINEYYLLNPYQGTGTYFYKDGSVNPAGGPKDGMIRTDNDMRWLEAMVDAGNRFLPNEEINKNKIWYGDYIYADVNGDGIYGNEHDYTFQNISATPKFYYGFQIDLAWKGIDLSVNFAGAGGNAYFWYYGGANSSGLRADLGIGKRIGYDHYFRNPDNPADPRTNLTSKNARITLNYGSEQSRLASTLWLYRADYLRLKNLTVGYSFPSKWMKKAHMQELRLFFSGENLWTITKYPGLDPEVTDTRFNFYSNLRQLSFGINIKF